MIFLLSEIYMVLSYFRVILVIDGRFCGYRWRVNFISYIVVVIGKLFINYSFCVKIFGKVRYNVVY